MLTGFQKYSGFTLVEVMVVITIILIATTLGMPSYRTWLQNTQIRNAAESIQNGMQKARAEAVKRNANIEFVLGIDPNPPHLLTNPLWTIQIAGASSPLEVSTTEGAKNVTAVTTPSGGTTITFNNLGTVGVPPNQPNNTDGSAPLSQIDLDSSVLSATDSRNLSVTVGVAGNVKMCDPDPGLPTTDPRKC